MAVDGRSPAAVALWQNESNYCTQLRQYTAEAMSYRQNDIKQGGPRESMYDVSISVCKSNSLRDDTRGNLLSHELNGAYVSPVWGVCIPSLCPCKKNRMFRIEYGDSRSDDPSDIVRYSWEGFRELIVLKVLFLYQILYRPWVLISGRMCRISEP